MSEHFSYGRRIDGDEVMNAQVDGEGVEGRH